MYRNPIHPDRVARALGRARALAVALALLLAPATPRSAAAINYTWTGAINALAGNPGNWNPAGVPGAADWVIFDTAGAYDVTFGSLVPTTTEFIVRDGEPHYTFATPHTVSTILSVSNLAAGPTPNARIDSGTLTLAGNFSVGTTPNADASLSLWGSTTSVTTTSASGWTRIGSEGTGKLYLYDGATLTLARAPEIGRTALGNDGDGELSVYGEIGGATAAHSKLIVTDTTNAFLVGAGASTGSVTASANGDITIAGDLTLANSPGGVATFLAVSPSAGEPATVTIGGDLNLTRDTGNGVAGGNATYLVADHSLTTVAGTTWTYDDIAGGSGKILASGTSGVLSTHDLRTSDPNAQLQLFGSTVRVDGGTLDLGGKSYGFGSLTWQPVLELAGGATADLHGTTSPTLTVGEIGQAELRVLGGSTLAVHDFGLFVGNVTASGARLVVDTGGQVTVDDALIVGHSGPGDLLVSGGSQVTAYDLGFATLAGPSTATGTIESLSDVHATHQFDMSGVSSSSGMASQLTVTGGARLWLDAAGVSGQLWQGSALGFSGGGELHLAGVLVDRGSMSFSGGALSEGGTLQPIAGGVLSAEGTLHSALFTVIDTTGVLQATGDLTIGDDTALGMNFVGLTQVGTHRVRLVDADSAAIGRVTLSGGTLVAPPGGLKLIAGRNLSGTGTVSGLFRPYGNVVATGTEGIAFDGIVLGQGQTMSGTLVRMRKGGVLFGGVGNYGGTGVLAASVEVDSGGTIFATNDMTLGSGVAGSHVTIDGLFAAANSDIDIVTADTTRVSGVFSLLGGTLTLPGTLPLRVLPKGRLLGTGTVIGGVVVDGTLEPGTGARSLTVQALRLRTGSTLAFDVGSPAATLKDSLAAVGTAVLGGTLALHALPGFALVPGDSFLVVSAGTLSGAFAAVTLYGADASGAIVLHTHNNQVWAVITNTSLDVRDPLPGDGDVRTLRFASLGSPARSLAFALELPEHADVTIELFDVAGRHVSTLQRGPLAAGRHRFAPAPGEATAPGLVVARARIRGADGRTIERLTRAVQLR